MEIAYVCKKKYKISTPSSWECKGCIEVCVCGALPLNIMIFSLMCFLRAYLAALPSVIKICFAGVFLFFFCFKRCDTKQASPAHFQCIHLVLWWMDCVWSAFASYVAVALSVGQGAAVPLLEAWPVRGRVLAAAAEPVPELTHTQRFTAWDFLQLDQDHSLFALLLPLKPQQHD